MELEFSAIIIVMLRHAELPMWKIILNYAKTGSVEGRCVLKLSTSSGYDLGKSTCQSSGSKS